MRPRSFSLFNYTDYRLFLADYYKWHKENTRGFSHRLMAGNLGFTSPNFLKLVIDGERNLGRKSLDKVCRGLCFTKQESEYFAYLVFFAQARNNVDKNYYFGLIASLRTRKNVFTLKLDQHEYFSEWYHPAVRELVEGKSEPLDYNVLSSTVGKKISPARIKKSVELLLRLGLLRLNDDNVFVHVSPLLNTENEIQTVAIRRYHKGILGIAQQALDEVPPEQRENSQVTIKISPEAFGTIKKRIQEFRDELLQLVANDRAGSGIYHVNFQLYPIAKVADHEADQ
jgi:uncharacterized protein (TIGR02147 family)